MSPYYRAISPFLWFVFVAISTTQTTEFKDGISSVNVTRADGQSGNSTDEFRLQASGTSLCGDDNAELTNQLGAECSQTRGGKSRTSWCELSCRCSKGTSNFILSERRCEDERKFREGENIKRTDGCGGNKELYLKFMLNLIDHVVVYIYIYTQAEKNSESPMRVESAWAQLSDLHAGIRPIE